jgi:hypothetical protein
MKNTLALSAAAVALLALGAAPLAATSALADVIIGNPPDGGVGDCIPFGCTIVWPPEFQQVYASSDFSGTITIRDLEFYNTITFFAGELPNSGNYKISLSTTSAPVNGLNQTNLAANIGANNTLVFDGSLPGLSAISGKVLDIILSTPFTYNPADGNLLMDVVGSNLSNSSLLPFDVRLGTAAGLFSIANIGIASGGFATMNWGLVTGFSTTIPEPSTWTLMALGFAGLGLAGWQSRRRSLAIAA